MIHVALLLGCAVAIYLACEWFVNAVEWLGVRLRVGSLAVGTVLAAAGTALPESVVTLVAVTVGDDADRADIGVGAAMGGPLVVGTLAYAVTGAVLLVQRSRRVRAARPQPVPALASHGTAVGDPAGPPAGVDDPLAALDSGRLARDQAWFLAIFTAKVALGLVAFAVKPWLGWLFFAAYAVYFVREMRGGSDQADAEDLEPLRLQPDRSSPATWAVLAQTAATLVVIFLASQLFVTQLEWAGPVLGLPPAVVALLLAPIATELPEILNAIIWVRQRKAALALANLSGSMMIQATIPAGLGILFTPWQLTGPLVLAGIATALSVGYLLALFATRRATPGRLAGAAAFYAAFGVALAVTLA